MLAPVSDCRQLGLIGSLSGVTPPRSLLQAKQIVRATCAPRIANRSCRCGVFSSQDKQYACGTTMSAVRFGFLIMRAPADTIVFRSPVSKRQRAESAMFGTQVYRISCAAALPPTLPRNALRMCRRRRRKDLAEQRAAASGPSGITRPGAGRRQGHGCRIPS